MKATKRLLAIIALRGAAVGLASAADEAVVDPATFSAAPRVVSALSTPALPGRRADPAWLRFQEGLRAFEDKRLGQALAAFKDATSLRSQRLDAAAKDIGAALADENASKAGDSIISLARILASRDLTDRELASIRAESGSSLALELALLSRRRLSGLPAAFVSASILVIEERGAVRIGDSLSALRQAAAYMRHYPEAEFWIGRVFQAEGESKLAELQFTRAIDMRESLESPEDLYPMLEAQAAALRDQGRWKDYESALRRIVDSTALFSPQEESLRQAMERTLERDGIDKFMTLYRIEDAFALGALGDLGAYYLENGRSQAVIHLAAAANASMTRAIQALRTVEPDYSYSTLAELAARIGADRELSAYAAESNLWGDLTLLGEALALVGSRDGARSIWRVVASASVAGRWSERAAAALRRGAASPYPSLRG